MPTFPFVMGRDGGPELVIRGEHPVIAMPVLPRWRHEIGQPVQEVERRPFDDAVGARPRGLPPAPRADPVGCRVSREHVADAGDAAVFAADHGEPLRCRKPPMARTLSPRSVIPGVPGVAPLRGDRSPFMYGGARGHFGHQDPSMSLLCPLRATCPAPAPLARPLHPSRATARLSYGAEPSRPREPCPACSCRSRSQ